MESMANFLGCFSVTALACFLSVSVKLSQCGETMDTSTPCLTVFEREMSALNQSGNLFCPATAYNVTMPGGEIGDTVCFPPTLAGEKGYGDCPSAILYFKAGKHYGRLCGADGKWTDQKDLLGCLSDDARCRMMGECTRTNKTKVTHPITEVEKTGASSVTNPVSELKNQTVTSTVLTLTPTSEPANSSMPTVRDIEEDGQSYREDVLAKIVAYTTFVTAVVSLPMLVVSVIIYYHFRSLHCPRNFVHSWMMWALIMRSVMWIIYFEPFMRPGDSNVFVSYLGNAISRKIVDALMLYSVLACLAWTVVEGYMLTVGIYSKVLAADKTPYWILHLLAWGTPLCVVTTFVCVLETTAPYCWDDPWDDMFDCEPYIWIVCVPVILAILTNVVCFLLVVVYMAKKECHNAEIQRYSTGARRMSGPDHIRHVSVKASILIPLLTLGQAVFFFRPYGNFEYLVAYDIGSTIAQTTQGALVCILYCFTNNEVQVVVLRWWKRKLGRM